MTSVRTQVRAEVFLLYKDESDDKVGMIKNMKILGIETSCDETALSIIEGKNTPGNVFDFSVLSTSLFSQIKIHAEYGGVFPAVAKREHAKNLVPLLQNLFDQIHFVEKQDSPLSEEQKSHLRKILEKEVEIFEPLLKYIEKVARPDIDAIAVTFGPGLEPALWVGISFAKALGYIWGIPVIPVNHMEGHILSVLTSTKNEINFPALALLISGGHTEIVQISGWGKYKVIGETRDDAVGEAFDKVARMLSLPYPGGPEISKLAEKERREATAGEKNAINPFVFPRPMIHSHDFDFSFSGLKTSVLYTIKEIPELTEKIKQQIALAFEDAVVEVLLDKTKKAIEKYGVKSLIIGGGVIANKQIRSEFLKLEKSSSEDFKVFVPEMSLATDNAVMIAMAGYIQILNNKDILKTDAKTIRAEGNARL
ncbi:MAG: tRNA (adenosine(37)-N6)-threonylcarbamoyltransferase complex transferase subunit TsaD [Candidatus Paceibacterota bacterium]